MPRFCRLSPLIVCFSSRGWKWWKRVLWIPAEWCSLTLSHARSCCPLRRSFLHVVILYSVVTAFHVLFSCTAKPQSLPERLKLGESLQPCELFWVYEKLYLDMEDRNKTKRKSKCIMTFRQSEDRRKILKSYRKEKKMKCENKQTNRTEWRNLCVRK